jgi:multimeric flavodoxin WrbA
MVVLGFSSSPVRDGNVDRMVKQLLEETGRETRFINLHDLTYGPCHTCGYGLTCTVGSLHNVYGEEGK